MRLPQESETGFRATPCVTVRELRIPKPPRLRYQPQLERTHVG
jgi:hypothetical protein